MLAARHTWLGLLAVAACTDAPPPDVHKTRVEVGAVDNTAGQPAIDAPSTAAT